MKTELKPYICPVCSGNGIVPNGFYNQTSGHWLGDGSTEKCRACNGSGIVWAIQDERFCSCAPESKTGCTSAMHCNICGKIEQTETWLK